MTLHALASSRAARSLQLLRTLIYPLQQDKRQIVCRSFSSDGDVEDGIQGEKIPESNLGVQISESQPAGNHNPTEELETQHVSEFADANTVDGRTVYESSIKVSAPLVGLVAGRRGLTRSSIEKATQANIYIPPPKEVKQVRSSVNLVVKGPSQKSVDSAITRIKTILRRAEKNPSLEYSHFISVPLASHQDLVERVRKFRQSVLADVKEVNTFESWFPESDMKDSSEAVLVNTSKRIPKAKNTQIVDPELEDFFSDDESSDDEDDRVPNGGRSRIRRSFFVKPETFHLTVLMLKLFTEQSVNLAAEVLQGVQPEVMEVLNGYQPKMHLRGIECLRGTPAEARVVCMRVHEVNPDNPFHQACYVIKNAFIKAGLVAGKDKTQDLKLHATLMNANYSPRLRVRSFDARNVLSKHWREDWGEYTINEIHLSQRFFYDPNGYYRCCGSLELPSSSSEEIAQEG